MVLVFEEEPNTDDCEYCGDIFCFGSCLDEILYEEEYYNWEIEE